VNLVDSSTAVATEVGELLRREGIKAPRGKKGRMNCFVSDDVEDFRGMAGIFLREKVGVKKVVL
jgi:glutamate racemase